MQVAFQCFFLPKISYASPQTLPRAITEGQTVLGSRNLTAPYLLYLSFLTLNFRNSHSSEGPVQQACFFELLADQPCEPPTRGCPCQSVHTHACSRVLCWSVTHLKWFYCSFMCALFASFAEAWPSRTLRILNNTSFSYAAPHFGRWKVNRVLEVIYNLLFNKWQSSDRAVMFYEGKINYRGNKHNVHPALSFHNSRCH